jgi:hypothetical protein
MLALLIAEAALDEREGVPVDVPFNSPVAIGMEAMIDEAEDAVRENVRRSSRNVGISSLFR